MQSKNVNYFRATTVVWVVRYPQILRPHPAIPYTAALWSLAWSRSEGRTHNCCPASRLGSIHANSTCPQDIYTASTRPGSLAAGATVLRGRASPALPPRLPRFPRFPTPDCNRGNDIIAQPRHVPHVQDGAASGRAGRLARAQHHPAHRRPLLILVEGLLHALPE